ncbi:radical SAM protein, partial [Pelagibacteraceae bacterium]|nr:radical SAM protein [Pelagibacteraceae bacterium]
MTYKKLKIYLCDLTYDTIILVSDTIPINIGFIGSYMKKKFGNNIEISLFKYPNTAIEAIKKEPPDLICLSNYSWNSNLSEYVASIAKKINPKVITTQGGTNFPHSTELQLDFLSKRPATDIYTVLEGEKSCSNVVQRILDSEKDRIKIFELPIDGCVFIHPDSKKSKNKKFIIGAPLTRIKDLDEVPSPYLSGIVDKFFDGKLTPFIETNRGCPFTCSFCHTGSDYFHKLNKFSGERVKEEINYIGKKAGKLGITNLHMADVNFGMYPQDKQVCEWLLESKEKYGWPLQVMATTGKNSKKRVMEITSILGSMFSVNMSLQSMDDQVLENIKRSNIKLDHMVEVNDYLRKEGRSTKAELILPLPGETKESFIRGLNDVLNSNASSITIYTLMMLNGTEFKSPDYRKKFGYKGKFRIVPLNFGEYDGERIFDFEEAGIETKDLSFNDYLFLRGLALLVESLYNGRPFNEFFRYAKMFDIQPATL